jgi:hypothetical protein
MVPQAVFHHEFGEKIAACPICESDTVNTKTKAGHEAGLRGGYWSLVIGHWSLVTGHWSLVTGYWLLVICHQSFATGYSWNGCQ